MMTLLSSAVPTDEAFPEPAEAGCDEAQLVHNAVCGDQQAFAQIVHLHGRRIFLFLQQMTRQRQDAEDLTQQTFVKAFGHLSTFDTRRPLINWLFVIARRTAINHFRSSKKWEFLPDDTPDTQPTPARSMEEKETGDNLWTRARALLPARQFEVLWLRFAEDLSTRETARVAGLTEIHVKVLIYRARQALLKGVQPL